MNVLLSLYSLHPSKFVIPLCILCTRIYTWILQILALPGNFELFKSYGGRILFGFFFKFFTTLPPLRRFQNIGLSLGSYRILTNFFSSRYVNSSKKQWKSHWVSVEYYLFRILWMLTLLGTLRSNDAHGDENVKKQ